jgi:hypothetical protein
MFASRIAKTRTRAAPGFQDGRIRQRSLVPARRQADTVRSGYRADWRFGRVRVHDEAQAQLIEAGRTRTSAAVQAHQGGTDGRSVDGEEDYPRQQVAPTETTNQTAPVNAPAQAAGTYATAPDVPTILADPTMSAQLQRA